MRVPRRHSKSVSIEFATVAQEAWHGLLDERHLSRKGIPLHGGKRVCDGGRDSLVGALDSPGRVNRVAGWIGEVGPRTRRG